MESIFILTQNSGRILGPIAKLLGLLMNGIYILMDNLLNIQNVALTIIIFTVVIYLCLLPLTYQQQKFSKMSQLMNPEIQAIQKKYKGRRDQASMNAVNEETQAVYKKYGVSPSGSCIYMIIQLPILFALYRVIYNVPGYITRVKETFDGVVTSIMNTNGYQDVMNHFLETVSNKNPVFRGVALNFSNGAAAAHDSIIDVLYKCTSDNWGLLRDTFSGFGDLITSTQAAVEHFNNFLGVSIVYSPKTIIGTGFREGHALFIIIGILIPVISTASQFLNIRLMPQPADAGNENGMANQMKMMNYFMPIYSFFIVFFLPIGVGVYWIAGSLIRSLQQFIFNKYFDRMDMEKFIKENEEKAKEKMKKKIEKKGVSAEVLNNAARINTRSIDAPQKRTMAQKAASVSSSGNSSSGKNAKNKNKNQNADKGNQTVSNKKYKEGSLAAKANLVRDYNEKNTKSK